MKKNSVFLGALSFAVVSALTPTFGIADDSTGNIVERSFDGGHEVVYSGSEGKAEFIAMLEAEADELLYKSESEGLSDKEQQRLDAVSAQIAGILEASEVDHQASEFAKSSYSPGVVTASSSETACDQIRWSLSTDFTPSGNIYRNHVAQASASSVYGTQFGPVPPPTASLYRSVRATINGNTTDFQSATDASSIEADVSKWVFPGSCELETQHAVVSSCPNGSSTFQAVTRTQSCQGIIDGDPIVSN